MSTQSSMLCKDGSKIIFVSGWGGINGQIDSDVRESAWKLHSLVYDVSHRVKSRVLNCLLYIVNKSKSLDDVSVKNKQELLEMVFRMPLTDTGVTRVIFAHSHGAKIVYEALKQESLSQFLISKGISNASERIKLIRAHLAIFTLGGIEIIPKEFAQICYNLWFKDDGKAKTGLKLHGKNESNDANLLKFGRADSSKFLDSIKDAATDAISSSVKAGSEVLKSTVKVAEGIPQPLNVLVVSVGSASASASASGGSLLSSGRHYINEYLECEELTEEILSRLGVETKKDV